jgi:hypothetical protein
MQFKKKLNISWLIASASMIVSILFPIIPCQVGANVPNSNYYWSMCRLSPDLTRSTDLKTFFFGYTSSMTESYFILLILVFIVTFTSIHLATRKKKE